MHVSMFEAAPVLFLRAWGGRVVCCPCAVSQHGALLSAADRQALAVHVACRHNLELVASWQVHIDCASVCNWRKHNHMRSTCTAFARLSSPCNWLSQQSSRQSSAGGARSRHHRSWSTRRTVSSCFLSSLGRSLQKQKQQRLGGCAACSQTRGQHTPKTESMRLGSMRNQHATGGCS